ncbi:MAG: hypothetical protein WC977_01915 [Anaerovoracaceae bacterium]|jgi:hypothetical protein
MKTTAQQQELLRVSANAALKAGQDIEAARLSVNEAIRTLDEVAQNLEDPAERISWHSVRMVWIDVRTSLERAIGKFQDKG